MIEQEQIASRAFADAQARIGNLERERDAACSEAWVDTMPAAAWLYPQHDRCDRGTYADVCPVPGEALRYIRPPRWRTVGEDGMPEYWRHCMVRLSSGVVAVAVSRTERHDVGESFAWRAHWVGRAFQDESDSGGKWLWTPIAPADRWVYLDEVLALLDDSSAAT